VNIHDQDIYFKAKNEGIAQGISQGEYQAKIETAKNMLKDKLSLETIIKYTGLSESIILKLSAE
jgi:predicted transposase/invertase (TIGR01784 family)